MSTMLTSSFAYPIFASRVAITIAGFSTLADATTVTSSAVDNSIDPFSEYLIQVNCGGTAAATAWLDVRMLVSTDGGSNYQTWENGFVLPPISLTVTPQIYQARVLAPQYWKLAIRNNTGAVLTSGTAFYQGIRR